MKGLIFTLHSLCQLTFSNCSHSRKCYKLKSNGKLHWCFCWMETKKKTLPAVALWVHILSLMKMIVVMGHKNPTFPLPRLLFYPVSNLFIIEMHVSVLETFTSLQASPSLVLKHCQELYSDIWTSLWGRISGGGTIWGTSFGSFFW